MISINSKDIVLTFIPVFVAMDPLGNTPIFISLTEGLSGKEKRKVIKDAVITACVAIIVLLFVGKGIFILLGITVSDFMVAGGILLLIIATTILLNIETVNRGFQKEVGIVPLGTPLIAGPAIFTTSLILIDLYGITPTIISLVINISITGIIFINATYISEKLGSGGTKAASKITAILLAAIAVMMIRMGILEIIRNSL